MDRAKHDALIAQMYSAAAGRQKWELALDAIAAHCSAWAVQMLAVDKKKSTANSAVALFSHVDSRLRPEVHLDYLRRYQHMDPRALKIVSPRESAWFHCHEVVSEEDVAASPFYQDFLIPYGGRYLSAVPIFDDDSMGVMLCILRGVGQPPLEAALVDWLDSLKPHFSEAMAIYRHLSELHVASLAGQAILDRMRHPVLLVDAARNLRFANAAGRNAIAAEKAVRMTGTRLDGCNATDTKAIAQALNQLVVASPDMALRDSVAVRLRGTAASQRFALSLSALRPSETGGAFGSMPLAMVLVHDGNLDYGSDPFALAQLYGLTPAEGDIGAMLTRGASPQEIAARRNVAVSTVRTQVRSLMDKTNARHQIDLVSRLMRMPRDFAERPLQP
jgi:DNA-binding CsgD family transcriptional regulator